MNIYIFAIIGLIIGAILGWIAPLHLAAFDAVFGGSRAALERTFDLSNFVIGFFSNMVLAVILVYVGDLIGINLYYVALIGFGLRVFINVGAIRKIIMTKRF